MSDTAPHEAGLVLVTGPAGAGRTTGIRVLEDLGYEAIDNMPIRLLPRLFDGASAETRMALGIDTRNRDFSTAVFWETLEALRAAQSVSATVLYLDCRAEVLLRRFSETRRRHPLAPAESPGEGIKRDFEKLAPIRDRADVLIDTSELNIHQLRAEIERWFAPNVTSPLALSVESFSYKRGLPQGVDMIFDCRFLNNPHWQPDLRPLDGRDPPVADYVRSDSRFQPFFDRVVDLTQSLLPAYVEEGKSHLSIGFGCTGGQHRSVMLTETLAMALAEEGWQVSIRHRELERRTSG